MEFGIDLDKVLDEFEENEGLFMLVSKALVSLAKFASL